MRKEDLGFDILGEVEKIEEDIINWRRDLHQIPELGLDLPKTSAYVQNKLKEFNIPYETLVNGNAVVGLIKGEGGEGKTIALRADMDGLPIEEETGLPFASKNGCMHACGHDAHAAILLGAAKILNENKDKFKGNVKLMFQPGEEYPGGAKPMIEEGVLENPKVDAALGLHVGSISPELENGKIGIAYRELMASMDRVYIEIIGKGGHGAYPHSCIDPIVLATEVVQSLQKIVSRETSPTDPAVLSICRIEGGFNQNIIPDKVELEGTVRTFDNNLRKRIARRIEEIVKGITESNGATYNYQYDFKYPALINNKEFTENFKESALKILGEDKIVELEKPFMGGEDMAYFLEEVPGTFFYLSNILPVDGVIYGHHNSKFTIDESKFKFGSSLLAQGAIDFLNK